MKYEKEFNETNNIQNFIKLCMQRYKDSKKESLKRAYYKIRKYINDSKEKNTNVDIVIKEGNIYPAKIHEIIKQPVDINYQPIEIEKPSHQKLLIIIDMLIYNQELSIVNLRKQGFKPLEINWLKKNLKVGE